jgi:hypothetical protein
MVAKRYRMRFDFQLNIAKDDENAIAEQILELKGQGLYSKTVRDGISLVSDLRAGSLEVLFDLFPWVRADFLEYMASIQSQKNETELVIAEQLARIETMLSRTGEGTSRGGQPKPLHIPAVPESVFDDDDDPDMLTLTKVAATGKATQNFLNSISRLQ